MTVYNRAVLMVVAGGFFLSTLGIGTRLMDNAEGLQIVFYRAVGQAVFMALFLLYRQAGSFAAAFKIGSKQTLLASVFMSLASLTLVFSLVRTTVANTMFIVSLAPLITALLAWMILGEKVRAKTWVAIAVAVFGVIIMVNGSVSAEGVGGILLALSMAVFYSLFVVTVRAGRDSDMLPVNFWSAVLLILSIPLFSTDLDISQQDLIICLLLGVAQTGLGVVLIISGSKIVPAAQVTLLAMLEVVLSPVWVWLGVGEVPSSTSLLGGGIIFAAILYQAVSSSSKTQKDTIS